MPDTFKEYEEMKTEIKSQLTHDFDKKFTALFRQQDEINKGLFKLTNSIAPIVEAFNNYKGFKRTVIPFAKAVIFTGTFLGAAYLIVDELKKFFKTH